tara:strand:+ start:276 stop:539 length:264 start_codon:yes stop_codon:yes gene_type:complete
MKNLIASLKNLLSKKQVVNNTFDACQCKFDTIVANAIKFDGRQFDAQFWATAKAATIFYKEGYSFEQILGYSKVSKHDLTFMLMLTA